MKHAHPEAFARAVEHTGVNAIAAAMRAVVGADRLDLSPDWHCIDVYVSGIRTMRDPDGETSHAVVTIEVLVVEVP